MAKIKKSVDKDQLRQRRAELYEAIASGGMTLQDAVKEMRAISRLTQAEFAAHRGVSTKVIKEIEGGTGNPTVNTLNRIGSFFGLEVAFVRKETLRGQQKHALAVPTIEKEMDTLSSIAKALRLSDNLEQIKKLAGPSLELKEQLRGMESNLETIQKAQRPDHPAPHLQVEISAIKKAIDVANMTEKIQHQIQPPDAVKKWLADLEKIEAILHPLKKYDFDQKK
jgi:DNA-binding XRE family transcriptional regulator